MMFQTERTRAIAEGRPEREKLQMYNGKPYRTKAQKAQARESARKVNGTWVSNAPVTFHPMPTS